MLEEGAELPAGAMESLNRPGCRSGADRSPGCSAVARHRLEVVRPGSRSPIGTHLIFVQVLPT